MQLLIKNTEDKDNLLKQSVRLISTLWITFLLLSQERY